MCQETSPLSVKDGKRHGLSTERMFIVPHLLCHGSSVFTVWCEEHGLLKTYSNPDPNKTALLVIYLSVIRFRLKGTSIRQARIQNSFNGVWRVEKLHFHSCFKCIYTQKSYKISKLNDILPFLIFSCLMF